MPVITKEFSLTALDKSLLISLNTVGYMIGAFTIGTLADYVGRRKAFLISVSILSVGAVLTGISFNFASITLFRFIDGIGQGSELALWTTMISEFAPKIKRGRFMQYTYLFGGFTLGISPLVAVYFLDYFPLNGWRYLFFFGGAAAFAAIFIRNKYMPESPRWLALHGKMEEADKIVSKMEEKEKERLKVRELPPPEDVPADTQLKHFSAIELFHKPYIFSLVVAFLFWFMWYFGIFAFNGYGPSLIIDLGFNTKAGLLYTALGDTGGILGSIIAVLVIERLTRKYIIAIFSFVYSIGAFIAAAAHIAPIAVLGVFLIGMMGAANSAGYVFVAEVFPTKMRGTGASFTEGFSHLGAVISPILLAPLIFPGTARLSLVIIGIFPIIAGLIILAGIKTTRRALTDISH